VLAQAVRVLPRADQLFSVPRQRLDQSGEKLVRGLARNLHAHRRRFIESSALLSPTRLSRHLSLCAERTHGLTLRLNRAEAARLEELRRGLDAALRVLDGVSYRAVLERGFALVRGEDGKVKRRAAAVSPGERLSIRFADGATDALAQSGPTR